MNKNQTLEGQEPGKNFPGGKFPGGKWPMPDPA
jgi:hypothetical protein